MLYDKKYYFCIPVMEEINVFFMAVKPQMWLTFFNPIYKRVTQRKWTYYIYIFIASMICRFTYICYKSNEQQWKESKNETKKNNIQKYMSKQLHSKTVSRIRIERKDEEKSDTFVYVTKWSIQEKYDNKSIPRLLKLREENKSKQQHTQMKRGKVDSKLYMISTWKQWLYIDYIVSVDEVDIQPSYYL